MFLIFFRFKFYEIFFESYPQAIISLFVVLRLNINDGMYLASIVISFCSLLFGVAETITFKRFGDDLTKVVWCMLSLFIDCLFRALFFSFLSAIWVFPEKAGLYPMGLLYVLIMAIYIEKEDLYDNSYEATIKGALASLVASSWQDDRIEVCKEGGVISGGIFDLSKT